MLQHSPYSANLSPCDKDMIPKLKQPLQGKQFANKEEILTADFHEMAQTGMSVDATFSAVGNTLYTALQT